MYTYEMLKKYNYFNNVLSNDNISNYLDSLTGVLQRKYIFKYIENLMDNKTPFTMAILDIDNFKFVNDKYGHKVGDEVLMQLAENLINYIGEEGLVGRYGGDEFILIWTKSIDYSEIHNFYDGMCHNNTVFRKTYNCTDSTPFITGTIGSASYPVDGSSFNEMFDLCDKTLYRGKVKGRNCYIIYVEKKHKYITVQELAELDIFQVLTTLTHKFYGARGIKDKIRNSIIYLRAQLQLDNIYYIKKNGELIDVNSQMAVGHLGNLDSLLDEDNMYSSSYITNIKQDSLELGNAIEPYGLHSILFTNIRTKEHKYGYIFFALERTARIWQPNDKAILLYLSKLIASFLELHPECV